MNTKELPIIDKGGDFSLWAGKAICMHPLFRHRPLHINPSLGPPGPKTARQKKGSRGQSGGQRDLNCIADMDCICC